ncbi:hypothetical protein [Rufibacter psychrotolerans]|uniref:hypothetical protein n=1 Tax=Rufibacter psychrotolerans TaxID=2812556 RepID=UPI00196732C6|nr:hypothetical protein [Rufibacter sp. SYSU D00308]
MTNIWAVNSEHSYTKVEYVAEHDWFYIKWSGHINPDDVVKTAETYLTLQRERRCPKVLNDKSEVTGDWEEANDWLEYEWLPQVKETGLQYFAMVLARDLHDLGPAQDLQRRLSSSCVIELFRELSAAQQWLDSRP